MKIKEVVAFCSLFNALSFSTGFTANRSEWSVVPQLNPRPRVSVEVLMKDAQAKGIDDALRSSEEKKSLKRENVTIARTPFIREKSDPENRTNLIVHLITEPELRFNQQEKFTKGSRKNDPLNVILLLIDGLDDVEEDLKMQLENPESFPIQGFLQSCPVKPNIDPEAFYFTEQNINYCDCEDLLRSNIVGLLSWAQHEREMSTSVLYEMPTVYSRRIEMDSPATRVRRIDRQLHESWHQPNYAKRHSKLPKPPTSRTDTRQTRNSEARKRNARKDKRSEHEEAHVSGVLSRLREAFFRTLLKSLSGSSSGIEQDESRRRSFPPRGYSNFRELAARTLEELDSLPNERGYVLVATTGAHELTGALELLPLYVSPLDTLIIVTSPCPREKSSLVPFFARGPNAEDIIEANPISLPEIPNIIRGIISHGRECRGSTIGCHSGGPIRRDNAFPATVQPTVLAFGDPILIFSDEEIPIERFVRHDRQENKTYQKLKGSEKEHQEEKVPEAKKPRETKAITAERTDERDQIQLRMADETQVENSQVISSPSTLVYVTIVAILTRLVSDY